MKLEITIAAVVAVLGIACATPSVPIGGSDTTSTGTTGDMTTTGGGAGAGPGSSTVTSMGGSGGGTTAGAGGAPIPGAWENRTSNLANMPSECGDMTSIHAKPDEDMLIAGIAIRGLWASTDGGASWKPVSSDSATTKITNRPTAIVFDPQDKNRYWESGVYNGGGAYETRDNGATFTQLGSVTHVDMADVDLTDPERKTLIAGGHEQDQLLYRSTDGGMTWTNVGKSFPAAISCTWPLVIDAMTHVVGCGGWGTGPPGLLRTEDGGDTWFRVSTHGGGARPLVASDGSIYWPTFNGGGMVRSTDKGRTWTDVVAGGVISSPHPVELPDGRIASLNGRVVVTSSDHGSTWVQASPPAPFDPAGIAYSAHQKAFFVWHANCSFSGGDSVPPDAIQRYDFDYNSR